MLKLSKIHLTWAFISIVALRFVIGFHFFREGTAKLNTDWTAEYFLRAAKGPFSPLFHHLVDDMDGRCDCVFPLRKQLIQKLGM